MEFLGEHYGRKVYYFNDSEFKSELLPAKDWVWLCIVNQNISIDYFETLQRVAIKNNLLEFKGAGAFGEKLHDFFDEIVVNMEVLENHSEISIMTTLHQDQTLADAFWQSFYATCLPETTDLDNVTIVCTDLDNIDRQWELREYIDRFNKGWIPSG